MAKRVPYLVQVPLIQDTTHNLLTLLQAVEPDIPVRCAGIQIQFDPDGQSNRLFLGNGTGNISSARGVELVALQAWSTSFESNIIMLGDISIRTNGTGLVALCEVVVR